MDLNALMSTMLSQESIDSLGATALNKRINDLRNSLVAELEEGLVRRRKMESEMSALSSKDDIEQARGNAVRLVGSDSDAPAYLKLAARSLLLTKINPKLWDLKEKEILAKTSDFLAARDMVGCVAWLAAYPYGRTYDAEIDARLAAVRQEAAVLLVILLKISLGKAGPAVLAFIIPCGGVETHIPAAGNTFIGKQICHSLFSLSLL